MTVNLWTLRLASAAACLLVAPLATSTPARADVPTCYGHKATIVGTDGDDTLHGTSGTDVIVGLAGNDHIYGGGGRDYICGGRGWDSIWGGRGADHLSGGHQHDYIHGGTSNDVIDGGSSSDDLYDGPGHDYVHAGTGHDNVVPGPGDDVMDGGPPANRGSGDWADQLDCSDAQSGVVVDLGAGTASGPTIGHDTVRDIEWVIGSNHDDTLAGDDQNNVLYGQGGNDLLFGRGGDDDLRGDLGDDVLHGGDGDDLLVSSSQDVYPPNPETGNDVFDGGAGNDGIALHDVSGATSIDGGPGTDALQVSASGGPVADNPVGIDLERDTAQFGGDTIPLTGIEDVEVHVPGKVTVYGDEGPNDINVGGYTIPTSSDAFVDGRGGDDTLYADAGSVDGGDGYDKCFATATTSNCEADYYGRQPA